MAQHDYDLENNPGATFRADVNAALHAAVTINSGAIEPPTMYPGMFWLDTSVPPDGKLRQRNQANSGWIAPAGTIGEIRVSVLKNSQTWTKPPGLRFLQAVAIGGGGGAPAAPVTAAAQGSAASGGGGGGTSIKFYDAATLPAGLAVTIGAGGAATPSAGGTTVFSIQTSNGGAVGAVVAAGAGFGPTNGGAGGAGGGGDMNLPGGRGGAGERMASGGAFSKGGEGGPSVYTARSGGVYASTTTPGIAGVEPGGGAAGGALGASQAVAAVGAIGGSGWVVLTEYY